MGQGYLARTALEELGAHFNIQLQISMSVPSVLT